MRKYKMILLANTCHCGITWGAMVSTYYKYSISSLLISVACLSSKPGISRLQVTVGLCQALSLTFLAVSSVQDVRSKAGRSVNDL